jgi:hypothetical protein
VSTEYDGGVLGEVEGVGFEPGWLGELLEGAGVAVQAGGVPVWAKISTRSVR